MERSQSERADGNMDIANRELFSEASTDHVLIIIIPKKGLCWIERDISNTPYRNGGNYS